MTFVQDFLNNFHLMPSLCKITKKVSIGTSIAQRFGNHFESLNDLTAGTPDLAC